MNTPTLNPALTFEGVWAAIQESNRYLTEKFAESDRQRKENERMFKEQLAESDRQRKENERMFKEQLAENDRYLKKQFAENEKIIKANSREIGGISKSNGDVAESYFVNSFKKYPHFAGHDYHIIDHNINRRSKALNLEDEYDLVLYNNDSVVIIEIKYNAKKEDVEQILKKAETFKKLMPQYKDFSLYLGLAGLHVYQNAEKEAIKQGVAVIKQVGKKTVINDKNLKVF